MAEQAQSNNEWMSRENIEAGMEQARSAFDDVDEQVRSFVKERPFVAVGVAVLGGFVLGRLLSRL
jgi:ElaB/YqjD/DUF883 family membrane-anchored ribosome-binding protein